MFRPKAASNPAVPAVKRPETRPHAASVVSAMSAGSNSGASSVSSMGSIASGRKGSLVTSLFSRKSSGTPPSLHQAVLKNDIKRVKSLLKEKKRDVNKRDLVYRSTALHMAASMGNLEALQMLLSTLDPQESAPEAAVRKRLNLNAVNAEGKTPLILAAVNRQSGAVRLLLARGADPNAADTSVSSALHYAVRNGDLEMTSVLLEGEVDINVKDNTGSTALHIATRNGNQSIMELLLGQKADVNSRDSAYRTPLHVAVETGQPSPVVQALLRAGSNPTCVDAQGKSAIDYAGERGLDEIRDALTLKAMAQEAEKVIVKKKFLNHDVEGEATVEGAAGKHQERRSSAEVTKIETVDISGNLRQLKDRNKSLGIEYGHPTAKESADRGEILAQLGITGSPAGSSHDPNTESSVMDISEAEPDGTGQHDDPEAERSIATLQKDQEVPSDDIPVMFGPGGASRATVRTEERSGDGGKHRATTIPVPAAPHATARRGSEGRDGRKPEDETKPYVPYGATRGILAADKEDRSRQGEPITHPERRPSLPFQKKVSFSRSAGLEDDQQGKREVSAEQATDQDDVEPLSDLPTDDLSDMLEDGSLKVPFPEMKYGSFESCKIPAVDNRRRRSADAAQDEASVYASAVKFPPLSSPSEEKHAATGTAGGISYDSLTTGATPENGSGRSIAYDGPDQRSIASKEKRLSRTSRELAHGESWESLPLSRETSKSSRIGGITRRASDDARSTPILSDRDGGNVGSPGTSRFPIHGGGYTSTFDSAELGEQGLRSTSSAGGPCRSGSAKRVGSASSLDERYQLTPPDGDFSGGARDSWRSAKKRDRDFDGKHARGNSPTTRRSPPEELHVRTTTERDNAGLTTPVTPAPGTHPRLGDLESESNGASGERRLEVEVDKLRARLEDVERAHEETKRRLEEEKERFSAVNKCLDEEREQSDAARRRLNEERERNDVAKRRAEEEFDREIFQLQQELRKERNVGEEAAQQIATLQAELKQALHVAQQSSSLATQTRQQLDWANNELESQRAQLAQTAETVALVKRQADGLRRESEALQKDNTVLRRENENTRRENENKRRENDSLRAENQTLVDSLKDLKHQMESQSTKAKAEIDRLKAFESMVPALTESRDKLDARLAELTAESNKNAKEAASKIASLEREVKQIRGSLKAERGQGKGVAEALLEEQNARNRAEGERKEAIEERDKLLLRVKQTEEELQNARKRIAALTKEAEDAEMWASESSAVRAVLEEKVATLTAMSEQPVKDDSGRQLLESEVQRLLAVVENGRNANAMRDVENRKAAQAMVELEANLTHIRRLHERGIELRQVAEKEITDLRSELTAAKQETSAVNTQLKEERSKNRTLSDTWAECEQAVHALRLSEKRLTSEVSQLKEDNSRLSARIREEAAARRTAEKAAERLEAGVDGERQRTEAAERARKDLELAAAAHRRAAETLSERVLEVWETMTGSFTSHENGPRHVQQLFGVREAEASEAGDSTIDIVDRGSRREPPSYSAGSSPVRQGHGGGYSAQSINRVGSRRSRESSEMPLDQSVHSVRSTAMHTPPKQMLSSIYGILKASDRGVAKAAMHAASFHDKYAELVSQVYNAKDRLRDYRNRWLRVQRCFHEAEQPGSPPFRHVLKTIAESQERELQATMDLISWAVEGLDSSIAQFLRETSAGAQAKEDELMEVRTRMESVEAKLASVTTVSATEQRILQADLYSRTENVQKLEAERDSMAFRVARLEADLKLNAKHHAEEREGLREAHEDKVAQLQRQLRSMKDSFDEAESSRLELERKVQALKRHLAEKEAAVAIKEDEFRSTVGRLEMSKRQLEEDREALEKRLASEAMRLVKVEQEAAQKLNDAGATSAGEKRLLEEETSRLRSELRRLNTEYAGNQQENWKQLADAKLTKARLAEKETAVKELKAELDGVKVAHHHWETERARLLAELRDREDQLSALRKEFHKAQSAQAQVVLKKTELASEIGLLREAYENLRKTSQATIEQQMSRITRLEEANARNMQAYDGRDREVERSSKRKEADDAVVDPRVRLGPQLAREAERADLLERQLSREQEKCSQAEARLERLRSQHEEECHLVNRLRVEIAELTAREDSRRKLDTEAQSEKVAKLTATLAVSEKRVQELLGESNDLRQEMTRVEARVEAKVRDSYDGRLRRLVARLDRLHRDRDRMQEAQRENEEGLRNTYERQITALLRDIKRLKAALAEERRAAAAALSKLKEYGRAAAAYATPPPTAAAAAAARYPFTATASDAPANTLRSNQEIAAEEPARPPPPPPSDAAERRAAEKKRRDDIVEQRMREREAEFSAREEQVDKHIALLRMQAGVSASGTPPAVDSAADADSINL